jgi:hypothetical protein
MPSAIKFSAASVVEAWGREGGDEGEGGKVSKWEENLVHGDMLIYRPSLVNLPLSWTQFFFLPDTTTWFGCHSHP